MRVFLGLGSNKGRRLANLRRAVAELQSAQGVAVVARSSVYDTAPVDMKPGTRRFLNAVVELRTALAPRELLALCKEIEGKLGRRGGHSEPREIDLDILLYGSLVVDEEDLQIPHPALRWRAFVMEPLLEIWPAAQLPSGEAVTELLTALHPKQDVRRVGEL